MVLGRIKNLARALVRDRPPRQELRTSRLGTLRQAQSLGWSPQTVVDVGAAYGDFSLQCAEVFPDARYLLLEPLEEYAPSLQKAVESLRAGEHVQAAAASSSGDVTINVHDDLVGSSVYLESEDSEVNGKPRSVSAVTIDSLVNAKNLKPPFLLKIDVQGGELDVLAGADVTLRQSEYVLLEVSFFEFFDGGPQFHDVIAFMKGRDFVIYDVYGLQYRPLDDALSQADIAFVPERGVFREHHFYATRNQREQQDRQLKPPHGRSSGNRAEKAI